ncbi:coiled-coil domain-containing protein 170 [Apis laboriosa]|uniref:coiled-coil domain-containing protein 170 n=1 Tax=Apis laboriosa TaxID=183418 RepID=UPI001CC68144|nr:coiled-coil domain-containing protein 170 [Apis laboriosa]
MSSEEETKEIRETTKEGKETAEEDLQIFETLCISSPGKEEAMTHDLITTLRSEIAALEYKRDRLMSELQETKNIARSRDQRVVELQLEADQLREQAARQNSIVSSLKKRIQESEERERNLYAAQGRSEIALQSLERDSRYHEEKVRECEKRIRQLEREASDERESKERARSSFQEFAGKLAGALTVEYRESVHPSPELVSQKVEELVHEASRLRARNTGVESQMAALEVEFRGCRDALDRAVAEKEQLQRQASSQSVDLDRLKQDKECLEMRYRAAERELNELRDKLISANRSISTASGNISSQEALIGQLRAIIKMHYPMTSVVYQLQRRVRTLREQLQRRDLHLDLLRRKLSLQEESVKMKSLLQNERDEACLRAKKLSKQTDRLQAQILEERSRNRELSAQLTEAADYKIAALERSRKIDELQKRLVESEMLRTRYSRKLSMLKEQMRSATETAEQERSISDHSLQLLRDELAQVKQNLSEVTKRESQLQSFRVSVTKLLSEPICTPDYEIISRLQKMVAAHRDFTMISRRYEEPLETSPSRCTSIHAMHPPRSPGCARYEDNEFADPPDLRDIEDEFNKRPVRSSLLP